MSDKIRLNVLVTEEEMERLKEFCQQEGRTQTDVIRGYIRGLRERIR